MKNDSQLKKTPSKSETSKNPSLKEEDLVYGTAACESLFRSRPSDIKKVYLEQRLVGKFSGLLKYCSKSKIAYKVVDSSALENLTASTHHEGILLYSAKKKIWTPENWMNAKGSDSTNMLFLDEVGNPHNIGALLRTAVHFNFAAAAVYAENFPSFSKALARVAEGALEHIDIIKVSNSDKFFHSYKKNGYYVVGTSSHSKQNMSEADTPKPCILTLGNEVSGISGKTKSWCDELFTIAGSGKVESLNVSVAGALFMNEIYKKSFKDKEKNGRS